MKASVGVPVPYRVTGLSVPDYDMYAPVFVDVVDGSNVVVIFWFNVVFVTGNSLESITIQKTTIKTFSLERP